MTSSSGLPALSAPRAIRMEGLLLKRAGRHDPGRVDEAQAFVIVALDMVEADRLLNPRPGAQGVAIAAEVGIVGDAADVAFEQADIDRIESQQRYEQPPVGLGRRVA